MAKPSTPVALDAYGADGGPELVLDGARLAAADGIPVRIFGPSGLDLPDGVELDQTTEWIGNEAEPVPAVRSTPDASVVRAAAAVADGGCSSLVSAGSTGATMTAALFALKRAQGVHRPALAVQIPIPGADGPPLLFLDCGANTDVRPQHLIQFAFLGSAFSAAVLGVESPRVALLSVGEEQKKGRIDVVEAHEALTGSEAIRFIGNLEGRDLLERGGRRDRHRRLHRERHPEDPRGDRKGGGGRRPRRRALGPAGRRGRTAASAGPRRAASRRWTRTPSAERSCSACEESRWWPTEAPPPRESPTPSASRIDAVEEQAVERTAELLATSGATRDRASRGAVGDGGGIRDNGRRWSATR